MDIDTILRTAVEMGASDVHVVAGHVPMMRLHQVMTPLDFPVITPESAVRAYKHMARAEHVTRFEKVKDVDFSYELPGLGRFRVNVHMQRQTIGIAMRAIKEKIPPMKDLNLPEVISRLTYLPRGLVLVTGDTGSGKSTTLAAMIQAMNDRYHKHIITLEDPVEYKFFSNKCTIEQRELGDDVPSFASGLRHVLRQDPDIILVGEMRDLETTAAAITAAETGHLVLSTLHTCNASQTVERIIDMYPADQQNQIRAMLANTLQAVVSQTLFKRTDKKGMCPAVLWRQRTVWALALGFQSFRHQRFEDAIAILQIVEKFLDGCMTEFRCHGTRSRLYYFQGQVRQAQENLSDAANLYDRSLRSCFARLKERSDEIRPGDPQLEVERSFAYYGLGKLELRMGELDYEQGRLQSALRHAYAARSLLQTTEDPFLKYVAELLLCKIERARERLGKNHWDTMLPRIDECCRELQAHTAFRLNARIEQLTTKVYLLHHVSRDSPVQTELGLREAAQDLDRVAKEARNADLPRTAFQAALSRAETLMRIPDLPAAHEALNDIPSARDSETMTAQVEFLRGKIFQAGGKLKRAMACFQRSRKLRHESLVFRASCHLHILELLVAQRQILKAKEFLPLLKQALGTMEPAFIHQNFKRIEKQINDSDELAFRFAPDFDPLDAGLELKEGFLRYLSGLAGVPRRQLVNVRVWRRLVQRHPNIRVKRGDVQRWLKTAKRIHPPNK